MIRNKGNMRLLNTETYNIEIFEGNKKPFYAILSHTWGKEEVLLADIGASRMEHLAGWSKITKSCDIAHSEGWHYIWIDTCCIDKTSSAELSEAINSMYRWYRDAVVCYVYLEDFEPASLFSNRFAFRKCRWFSRGWTLQELLAPNIIQFYNRDWEELGTKSSLQQAISDASGIRLVHLFDTSTACAATKMSWASNRSTTRTEDRAYCLLGLFDVHMPLLYGEHAHAFQRLQAEILRHGDDDSIFAWTDNLRKRGGLLAE